MVDRNDPAYQSLMLYMHPKLRLPHNSAETLYLLHVVGGELRDFLNQKQIQQVPMEMAVELASGGRLTVKVVQIEETTLGKLPPALFTAPADYSDKPLTPPAGGYRKVDPTQ